MGSVCSGIGGAELAFKDLVEPVFMTDTAAFPRLVLRTRYPDVPLYDDLFSLVTQPVPCDLLVGGTPCTSFSIAGKRKSLDDARGNLALLYALLLDAIDEANALLGMPEATCLWENVPGVLSVKDNAFGCFLATLVGHDSPLVGTGRKGKWPNAGLVIGPRRTAGWRVLDAQYFGLAQRRRRVFVVASARSGFDPLEILFEPKSLRGNPPPRHQTEKEVTGTLASRATAGGGLGTDFDLAGGLIPVVADTLTGGTLSPENHRKHSGSSDRNLVVSTIDASFGRLQGCSGQDLNANHDHLIVQAFGGNNQSGPIEVATARSAHKGPHGRLDFETETFLVQCQGTNVGVYTDGTTGTLRSGNSHVTGGSPILVQSPVIAFDTRQDPVASFDRTNAISSTQPGAAIAFAENQRAEIVLSKVMQSLKGQGGKPGQGYPAILQDLKVRRLTPSECERLQGLPTGYTKLTERTADGPRYAAIGNGFAINVVRWIAERLVRHLESLPT